MKVVSSHSEGTGMKISVESNGNIVFVHTASQGLDILATVKQARYSADHETTLMEDALKVVGLTKNGLMGRILAAIEASGLVTGSLAIAPKPRISGSLRGHR